MDIIGFGQLIIEKIIIVDKLPRNKEEAFIKSIDIFPSGSAANTIAGLAKLGIKTGFIGKVGDDAEGSILLESMIYHGVDTKNIKVCNGRSGISITIIDEKNKTAHLFNHGVNDMITINDINIEDFAKTKLFHTTLFACAGTSFETQKRLLNALGDMKISIDPGHICSNKENEIKKANELIKVSDIVLISEETIKTLTGMNYKEGAKTLIDNGNEIVAVKLGKRGCYVASKKEEYLIPRFKVNVVDARGAGDAFNTGFLFGIIKNKSLEECGKLGNKVASFCIQKKGPRDGLPTLEELK